MIASDFYLQDERPQGGAAVIVGAGPAGIRAAQTLLAHGVKPVDTRQFADQSVEIKFAAFQGVVTEHETRQIAGIIEYVRQRLARGTYRSDQLTHPRRVFRLFCEMRSPDDGREWGPQLMADRGDKIES